MFKTETKIGINLYLSDLQTTYKTYERRGKRNILVPETNFGLILDGDTLLFDAFIKKFNYQVKPEFTAVAGNPAQSKKEQVSIERYYDIQFDVLSDSKESAIENYKKLITLINHLFYIPVALQSDGSLDLTKVPPTKFGNTGIIFKGNPPVSSSRAKGIVISDKDERKKINGLAKDYELIIITETFTYDIDQDKGYILVPEENFKDLADKGYINRTIGKERLNNILIPIAFSLSFMGTLSPDRYRPRVNNNKKAPVDSTPVEELSEKPNQDATQEIPKEINDFINAVAEQTTKNSVIPANKTVEYVKTYIKYFLESAYSTYISNYPDSTLAEQMQHIDSKISIAFSYAIK